MTWLKSKASHEMLRVKNFNRESLSFKAVRSKRRLQLPRYVKLGHPFGQGLTKFYSKGFRIEL